MKKYRDLLVLTLLILIAAPSSAVHATILFAGGEDSDFVCNGTCAVNTTTTNYDSNYAREAYNISFSSATDPPTTFAQSPVFTSGSILWIHASVAVGGAAVTNNAHGLDVLSPDGITRISLRQTSTTGIYKISTRNNAGSFVDLVTASACVTLPATVYHIDLFVNYNTSGEAAFYCNGTKIADVTGDVTTNGATQLNSFRLGNLTVNTAGLGTGWSEVIAATTNTTSMRVATLAPVANGNTDTWDVGGVSNVNEITLNDTTVNASGTATQVQLYTVGSLPSNNLQIEDLALSARALVDTTGPQHMQAMVRTSSTNYNSASMAPLNATFGPNWIDFPTNPNTGLLWTATDLGTVGFNIGYESIN